MKLHINLAVLAILSTRKFWDLLLLFLAIFQPICALVKKNVQKIKLASKVYATEKEEHHMRKMPEKGVKLNKDQNQFVT